MLLKNTDRRLITINRPDGKPIQLLPGDNPAVEVPDELCKSHFVKTLIKSGALSVQLPDEDEDEDEDANDLSNKTKEELLTIAKMIDPDAKGTKAQLIAIINGETE
jgi:hypothetical protein